MMLTCLLLPGPLAAYPTFDAPATQRSPGVEAFEAASPAALSPRPVRWLEDRGSAGFPDGYSDDAYSREEERLRDGE